MKINDNFFFHFIFLILYQSFIDFFQSIFFYPQKFDFLSSFGFFFENFNRKQTLTNFDLIDLTKYDHHVKQYQYSSRLTYYIFRRMNSYLTPYKLLRLFIIIYADTM